MRIGDWATKEIDLGDCQRFTEIVEAELTSLHEGNFARYSDPPFGVCRLAASLGRGDEPYPVVAADDFARRFSMRAGGLIWLLGAGASAAATLAAVDPALYVSAHSSASRRRRNVSLTYFPLRRARARQPRERRNFVCALCALRSRKGAKSVVSRRNGECTRPDLWP